MTKKGLQLQQTVSKKKKRKGKFTSNLQKCYNN